MTTFKNKKEVSASSNVSISLIRGKSFPEAPSRPSFISHWLAWVTCPCLNCGGWASICGWADVVVCTITKWHSLGGLSNWNLFSHGSEGWKSKTKVPAGWVFSEATLLGLQMAITSPCPHMISLLPACVLISSSHRDTRQIGVGPTQMTPFYLNYLF